MQELMEAYNLICFMWDLFNRRRDIYALIVFIKKSFKRCMTYIRSLVK